MEKNGFTLIELLLAIAILALVISLIYPSFYGTVGVVGEVKEESDLYQVARLILERITRELTSSFVAPARLIPTTSSSQEKSYSFFIGNDSENNGYPFDTLKFTATLSTGLTLVNTKESDLVVIEYIPDQNPEPTARGTILWRRESSITSQGIPEAAIVLEMGEYLKGIDYKFYDANSGEYVEEWNSETRAKGQPLLPAAVQVIVFLIDAKGKIRPFSTVIKIPINRLKDTTEQASTAGGPAGNPQGGPSEPTTPGTGGPTTPGGPTSPTK